MFELFKSVDLKEIVDISIVEGIYGYYPTITTTNETLVGYLGTYYEAENQLSDFIDLGFPVSDVLLQDQA